MSFVAVFYATYLSCISVQTAYIHNEMYCIDIIYCIVICVTDESFTNIVVSEIHWELSFSTVLSSERFII